MITLISRDDVKFYVPRSCAGGSRLVADALCFDDEEDDDEPAVDGYKDVEIQRVLSPTLAKVVEFLRHYPIDPMVPIGEVVRNTFEENVPQEWYRNYVDSMELCMMFAVREASNFMDIKPLLYLTNVWLTFQLMGKNVDEMHEMLNIPKMTEEDEANARREHTWIFEQPDEDD